MKYVVITIILIFSIFSILSFYFYRTDVSGVSFTNKKDSHEFLTLLTKLGIDDYVVRVNNNFVIKSYFAKLLMPDYNTLDLRKKMKLYNITKDDEDYNLTVEILLCLLNTPVIFTFDSFDEFIDMIDIRKIIVKYGYLTHVNFDTGKETKVNVEYFQANDEDIILLENKSLLEGIKKSIIPKDKLYNYSCSRITEFLLLLGLLEVNSNNPICQQIESIWRRKAIKSDLFRYTFLYEYGTKENPIPMKYYIPGDRIWFRNPDDKSSYIMGYEGTWVVYLNDGLFCDFWKDGGDVSHQHTLEDIIITIYNWRHSIINSSIDESSIDDKFVQQLNKNINNNPDIKNNIIKSMYKYGCMDKTRETFLPSKQIRENLTKIN